MVPLDSFRHAMLRVPGGELVDAFVADGGLGAKDGRAVLVVFDSVASESDILSAISGCGEVASARTAPLPVAEGVSDWAALLVVFEEDGALERVAKAGKPPAQAGEDGALVGMAKWVAEAEALLPKPTTLAGEVDGAMAAFEADEKEVERQRKEMLGRPDADGFVTVMAGIKSKGAGKTARAGMAGPDAWGYVSENRRAKNRRGATEAKDFYSFQKREKQINELEELRKKFDADKERVQKMRESRVFRPV
ncbi:hypothetical protein FNF31_06220 [Cafeteria roenbergensis]|uniref:Ribosomal RNA-processing protein 7 C-terminal domain-containing protein n=2 Tax=Cafeteria roenbergensis TaxID=33653 RepID=A0A5A8C8F0_CAFRO|nr:hypothetical protein FNF28_07480 [Cafeteria roenbergensis]KAA0154801.1 hypothetical protein FNF31_06220 [Cafeteria roenbergensis]